VGVVGVAVVVAGAGGGELVWAFAGTAAAASSRAIGAAKRIVGRILGGRIDTGYGGA
jgi:hypothetical protein